MDVYNGDVYVYNLMYNPAEQQVDFTPRSPAVADNEAAFPVSVDDRIAREVLYLKLSGAEGEQRRTTSQLCCVHLYCTCTPPLLLLNISDYVQISFHAHLKCIVVPMTSRIRLGYCCIQQCSVLPLQFR